MPPADIDFTVFPDECDAYGHLNQASYLALFERARWANLARGPGMDFFERLGITPVVRKTAIEYLATALPGDVLRFSQTLARVGRTSFTVRQSARRLRDDSLVATAEIVLVCLGQGGRPVPVPEALQLTLEESSTGGHFRRILVNGVNLSVHARGQGPAILFIHGYPLDHGIWEHPMGQLEGWHRIAPDLRGMGRSDAPDLGYSMGVYAEDLLALLGMYGVQEVVLCALSMGGYVAFEMLRRARSRIRGLVLMDTRAEADTPEGRRERERQAVEAREGGAAGVAATMIPRLLAPAAVTGSPELVARVRGMIEATPVPGILGAIGAMRDRPDSTPLLGTLRGLPTLVVVGEDDQITPPARARAMAEAIPGARLEVVPGAGHLVPMERPEEATGVLRNFLAELG